jgi:hypothetical protein
MTCRACGEKHSPTMRCEVWARIAVAAPLEMTQFVANTPPFVANKSVANSVTAVANKVKPKADAAGPCPLLVRREHAGSAASRPQSEAARVEVWRDGNRARYNERQAIRMRERRAEEKRQREAGFIGVAYG